MVEPARAEEHRPRAPLPSRNATMRRCATCGVQYPPDFVVCPKDATNLERADNVDEDPLLGEVWRAASA